MEITLILGYSGESKLLYINQFNNKLILDEIIKIFNISPWIGINFIFNGIVYSLFNIKLFKKIQKSEEKVINIILLDVFSLLKLTSSHTICQCKGDIIDKESREGYNKKNIDSIISQLYKINITSMFDIDKDRFKINFNIILFISKKDFCDKIAIFYKSIYEYDDDEPFYGSHFIKLLDYDNNILSDTTKKKIDRINSIKKII